MRERGRQTQAGPGGHMCSHTHSHETQGAMGDRAGVDDSHYTFPTSLVWAHLED